MSWAWWKGTPGSPRIRRGRWEFYRDNRDWWIGIYFAGDPGIYFAFLTFVAKRSSNG